MYPAGELAVLRQLLFFFVFTDSKCPGQTAWGRKLNWVFSVHICPKTGFLHHYKTSLFKYTENFTTKIWKISDKNSDIFHIFIQNTDCGYLLEPPWRGTYKEYPQTKFFEQK